MTTRRLIVALSVLSTIALSGHAYLWLRLVSDPAWATPWYRLWTAVLVILSASLPTTMGVLRFAPARLRNPVAWVSYVWLGFAAYLLVFLVVVDAARLIAWVIGFAAVGPVAQVELARRIALGVLGAAGVVGLAGLVRVARGFEVRRIEVALERLGGTPYRIVQLSDVHVGPTIGRAFVEELVRTVNALDADVVVITGDLVDGTLAQIGAAVEPLRELRARDGVFFVTGNHEYYWGADRWIEHLTGMGIRVLRNEHVTLAGRIELAGVDDWLAAKMLRGHGQDVTGALAGREPALPVVLLAHNPKTAGAAIAGGVDLMLSGHVHGGQMAPGNWIARLDQPLVAGLYRRGATWIYVSAGTGYWGPPMRVGTVAEVSVIELVPVSAPI